ncbi:MAG: glycosyltransferase [Phycisphaerae bacterium]|nr:glycosyltransferase [Phycisphaerae bacterium]
MNRAPVVVPETSSPAPAGATRSPNVVALMGNHPLSGVSVWCERMTRPGSAATPWSVLVVGEGLRAEDLAEFPGWGSERIHLAAWRRGDSPVDQVLAVRAALRALDADVVIPNDVPHGFACAALDAARGLRAAAVIHADDPRYEELLARAAPHVAAWRAVSRGATRRAAPLANLQGEAGPGGVIPCGVDVPALPSPRPTGATLRLLYAGRLDHAYKRCLDLVRLADELHARACPFVLTVVGDGPASDAFARAAAEHALAGRIRLPGRVRAAEVRGLLESHDALVMVSASEGHPTVAVEAMAASRACALTEGCGGAAARARDGIDAIIVPIGDMHAMAGRLHNAFLAGTFARMGAAAHAAARREYDLARLAPEYDRLIAEARGVVPLFLGGSPASLREAWHSVLAILESIGPCTENKLADLALNWLASLGVPVTHARRGQSALRVGALELPLRAPGIPAVAEVRLARAARDLRAQGVSRIALYGAGLHTRRLRHVVESLPEIVAILDDRAGLPPPLGPGERLWNLPILSPERLREAGVGGVIISSDEHEANMLRRASHWPVRVVPLYAAA